MSAGRPIHTKLRPKKNITSTAAKTCSPQPLHPNTIKIVHLNVERSILTKKPSLELFLEEINPDFFLISEHGLDNTGIQNVILPGYTLLSYFSRELIRWGGVAIFKNNLCQLETKKCDLTYFCKEQVFEIASIKISLETKELLLASIYRSPQVDKESEFFELFNDWLEANLVPERPVILGGDINIDLFSDSPSTISLKNTLLSFGLSHVINSPTRYSLRSEKCIDNFFTNQPCINNIAVNPFISDHLAISVEIVLDYYFKANKLIETTYRDVSENNLFELNFRLSKENWFDVFNKNSVNGKYNSFVETFKYYLDVSCPIKRIKCNKNNGKKKQKTLHR